MATLRSRCVELDDAHGRPGRTVTGYAPPGGVGALQCGYGPMVLLNKPLDPEELIENVRLLTGVGR